ncbi:hypothetical protein [Pseudomonas gessardii]|uniref:Uncharacterized protein n=1 Tax=Pseudomonas gessardii TaxID=78544 RepID=A0A7Y1MPP5_9PSED|nr:hypothetical protein [Pseudomonas gessardii]MRU48975.1 hypothetical protein [Pseudomonas gessardii]NNA96088.1 hypothetical protein [Pseudomonas gessardii]
MYIDTRRNNPNDSVCLKGKMTAKITIGSTPEPDFVAEFVWYGNLMDPIYIYGDQGVAPRLTAIQAALDAGTPTGKYEYRDKNLRSLDYYSLDSLEPWPTKSGHIDVTFSSDRKHAHGTMLIEAERENKKLTANVEFDIQNL